MEAAGRRCPAPPLRAPPLPARAQTGLRKASPSQRRALAQRHYRQTRMLTRRRGQQRGHRLTGMVTHFPTDRRDRITRSGRGSPSGGPSSCHRRTVSCRVRCHSPRAPRRRSTSCCKVIILCRFATRTTTLTRTSTTTSGHKSTLRATDQLRHRGPTGRSKLCHLRTARLQVQEATIPGRLGLGVLHLLDCLRTGLAVRDKARRPSNNNLSPQTNNLLRKASRTPLGLCPLVNLLRNPLNHL